jgi:hypothetical protein
VAAGLLSAAAEKSFEGPTDKLLITYQTRICSVIFCYFIGGCYLYQ